MWKNIPGFSRYQVNGSGEVRAVSTGRVLTQRECETTKGSYLTVAVIHDSGWRYTTYGVHQLQCLATHGIQPSDCSDVNHVDGDKHNNCEDNVEWVSRSGNITHSYATRLRTDSQPVRVRDVLTLESWVFYSMSALAAAFRLAHKKGEQLVNRYSDTPYLGRYVFELTGDYTQPKRANSVGVYAADPLSGTVYTADSIKEMASLLGLSRGTITAHLLEGRGRLLNGFVVSRDPKLVLGVAYTEAEVFDSKSKFHASSCKKVEKDTRALIHIHDGVAHLYRRPSDIPGMVSRHQKEKCRADIKLYGHHATITGIVKLPYVISACVITKETRPVVVTDNATGVNELFPSVGVFAEAIGLESCPHVPETGVEIAHFKVEPFRLDVSFLE